MHSLHIHSFKFTLFVLHKESLDFCGLVWWGRVYVACCAGCAQRAVLQRKTHGSLLCWQFIYSNRTALRENCRTRRGGGLLTMVSFRSFESLHVDVQHSHYLRAARSTHARTMHIARCTFDCVRALMMALVWILFCLRKSDAKTINHRWRHSCLTLYLCTKRTRDAASMHEANTRHCLDSKEHFFARKASFLWILF